MNLDDLIKRTDKVLASDMDGEIVMMDVDQGKYFGLRDVGAFIWAALEMPETVGKLIDNVSDHFEVEDEDNVEEDVIALLKQMLERNLVEKVTS